MKKDRNSPKISEPDILAIGRDGSLAMKARAGLAGMRIQTALEEPVTMTHAFDVPQLEHYQIMSDKGDSNSNSKFASRVNPETTAGHFDDGAPHAPPSGMVGLHAQQ